MDPARTREPGSGKDLQSTGQVQGSGLRLHLESAGHPDSSRNGQIAPDPTDPTGSGPGFHRPDRGHLQSTHRGLDRAGENPLARIEDQLAVQGPRRIPSHPGVPIHGVAQYQGLIPEPNATGHRSPDSHPRGRHRTRIIRGQLQSASRQHQLAAPGLLPINQCPAVQRQRCVPHLKPPPQVQNPVRLPVPHSYPTGVQNVLRRDAGGSGMPNSGPGAVQEQRAVHPEGSLLDQVGRNVAGSSRPPSDADLPSGRIGQSPFVDDQAHRLGIVDGFQAQRSVHGEPGSGRRRITVVTL